MAARWSMCTALRAPGRPWAARGILPSHTRLPVLSGLPPLSASRSSSQSRLFRFPIRSFGISTRRCNSNIVIRVPQMAESITEGTLNQFNKQIGEFVEQHEELTSIETDKIDVAVNAPHAGVIQQLLANEGDTVTVDQAIVEIEAAERPVANENGSNSSEKPRTEEQPQRPKEEPEPVNSSSPSAEQELPAKSAAKTKTTSPDSPESTSTATPAPQAQPWGNRPSRAEEKIKMTRIRQRTAQRLKESQNTAASLTTFNEVDMLRIIELRKRYKDAILEEHGVKMGFMGLIARASALALKEIPSVNASIEDDDTIVYRDYVDLSVAAAIPKGLVTPILRNIESMGIVEIEKGIAELVKKARDGKLTMDDLTGGSFTISNSGIWGSLLGTPILNLPQTAVLGTYGIQDRPVVINGEVEVRPMMYIALTYDHRIIDGREAVTFLNLVKKHLQDPESMLLE